MNSEYRLTSHTTSKMKNKNVLSHISKIIGFQGKGKKNKADFKVKSDGLVYNG